MQSRQPFGPSIGQIPDLKRKKSVPETQNMKKAICSFCSSSKNSKLITCLTCQKFFHKTCMKIPEPENEPLFECPSCILKYCDPLCEVKKVLIEPFVITNHLLKKFSIPQEYELSFKLEALSFGIEIRCIKLQDRSHEICWPNKGELWMNSQKVCDFEPLQANSSLKKRKDEKLFTNKGFEFGQENDIFFKVSKEDPTKKIEETCVAGLYLVKKLTAKSLIEKIKKNNVRRIEDCKKVVLNDFKNSKLDIDMMTYQLTCVFDASFLKTPAKGKHCKHINCFSLENFVSVWEKNSQRKWACPICKTKSFHIIVDSYFEEILEKVRKGGFKNPSNVSVEILKDATYSLSEAKDDSSDDEGSQVSKPKPTPSKGEFIVLDSDEEESAPKVNKEPEKQPQPIFPPLQKENNSSRIEIEPQPVQKEPQRKSLPIEQTVEVSKKPRVSRFSDKPVQKPPSTSMVIEEPPVSSKIVDKQAPSRLQTVQNPAKDRMIEEQPLQSRQEPPVNLANTLPIYSYFHEKSLPYNPTLPYNPLAPLGSNPVIPNNTQTPAQFKPTMYPGAVETFVPNQLPVYGSPQKEIPAPTRTQPIKPITSQVLPGLETQSVESISPSKTQKKQGKPVETISPSKAQKNQQEQNGQMPIEIQTIENKEKVANKEPRAVVHASSTFNANGCMELEKQVLDTFAFKKTPPLKDPQPASVLGKRVAAENIPEKVPENSTASLLAATQVFPQKLTNEQKQPVLDQNYVMKKPDVETLKEDTLDRIGRLTECFNIEYDFPSYKTFKTKPIIEKNERYQEDEFMRNEDLLSLMKNIVSTERPIASTRHNNKANDLMDTIDKRSMQNQKEINSRELRNDQNPIYVD